MDHSAYDCAPTLTDSQVLEFCKYGHLMLEGVGPEEIDARCRRWLDDHHAGDGPAELQELLEEEWFFEGVVRNPEGAGATGHDRYTERLAATDLQRVIYVYGTQDVLVGRLTEDEVAFLESRGATVIPIEGDHISMFEKVDAAQEISNALRE